MKRKIAAIFAADIAGYSRLVAEDEEETLRRLASYRQVTDDFIARSGGRIFNTAGDAVLAEFSSAVDAAAWRVEPRSRRHRRVRWRMQGIRWRNERSRVVRLPVAADRPLRRSNA